MSWLRALARDAHAAWGSPGVGAVGMCLTGGFALAMMVDDTMVAPVLSQPSMPFSDLRLARLRDDSATASSASRSTPAPATPYGIATNAHSVLTHHLVDKPSHPTRVALERVIAFFRDRLAVAWRSRRRGSRQPCYPLVEVAPDMLTQALRLLVEERAKVALELLCSMNAEPEPGAAEGGMPEIERRGAEVDADTADTMSLDQHQAHIRERRTARGLRRFFRRDSAPKI